VASLGEVVNLLVVLVLVDATARDEPGVFQQVGIVFLGARLGAAFVVRIAVFVAFIIGSCAGLLRGGFDLVEVFLGKEAPVAEQGLVYGTQLVDGQQLVADPTAATALAQDTTP